MNDSVMLHAVLALMILLFLLPLAASNGPVAAAEDDPILGAWRWEWTNNLDYTMKECPGGHGTMTATKGQNSQSISFKGVFRTEDGKQVEFSNSGSWEFVELDPHSYNRRKYRLRWGNDTDTVLMSDQGDYLRGSNGNGKFRVTGARQSTK
jgi:hypothetical protein